MIFLMRSRYRVLVSGTSFNCLPSFSGRRCLRPALSHPLSPGIPNLLAPVDRRRCNTIERHHSSPTGVSHPRKSIPRSRGTTTRPRHRSPRRELPASTQKGNRPRAAKSSIRTISPPLILRCRLAPGCGWQTSRPGGHSSGQWPRSVRSRTSRRCLTFCGRCAGIGWKWDRKGQTWRRPIASRSGLDVRIERSFGSLTSKGSSFASFFSKISDAFHVLFDPLANHLEGLFLRFGGHLR